MHSIAPLSIESLHAAFASAQPPGGLRTPLAVRAPETIFNDLSTLFKIKYGQQIDIWSIGCLVCLTGRRGNVNLTLYKDLRTRHIELSNKLCT